ncbi:MAG: hypothetical protein ACOYJB_06515 [Christensenellaceae bacterium]|jgi:hypothetical protein
MKTFVYYGAVVLAKIFFGFYSAYHFLKKNPAKERKSEKRPYYLLRGN